jgi:predicted outer membrane repeat protein
VTDSTFSANLADDGGGIDNGGTLTVTDSTLESNSAGHLGGAIYNLATLTVTDSTLESNSATPNPTFPSSHGGGIYNAGTLTVISSTLSSKSATSGGGIFSFSAGTLSLRKTIVAGNRSSPDSGPDISGSVQTSSSFNLVGIGDSTLTGISDGSQGNQIGTPDSPIDPRLAPLGDYGGPTQTRPLLPGSPALDAGDSAMLGTPDQRGVVRSGGVNIGVFQASAASFVVTTPATATAGVPFDVRVAAVDIFGQAAVGYTGTITFSTTDADPNVVLPPAATFGLSDGGVVTFSAGVTLFSPGEQTLTVTDPDRGITGSTVVLL